MEKIKAENIVSTPILNPSLKVYIVVEYSTYDRVFFRSSVHTTLKSAKEEMRNRFFEWEEGKWDLDNLKETEAWGEYFHIEIQETTFEVAP